MNIAVMQPYFLPYLGYFQLISAVDKFVVLDDVNFINRGWINRNRLLLGGKEHLFTLPLSAASQNKRICDIALATTDTSNRKLIKTIESAYGKAPQFERVMPSLREIILYDTAKLDEFLFNGLATICRLLKIDTEIEKTARIYDNSHLSGAERILDICRKEAATEYLNLEGGKDLYNRAHFRDKGVELRFLAPNKTRYQQYEDEFVENLSIMDVIMFNAADSIMAMLQDVRTT